MTSALEAGAAIAPDRAATLTTFFRLILPSEGWYCAVIFPEKAHHWFRDRGKMAAFALEQDEVAGKTVYHACASFKEPERRTKDNVHLIKSLWGDIDPKDGYTDKEVMQADLLKFCADEKLPGPIVVDSGGGLQFYITLERALTREEWEPYAQGFKARAVARGLKLDLACTGDAARILRPPGTTNRKREEPKPVRLVVVSPGIAPLAKLKQAKGRVTKTPALTLVPGLSGSLPEHSKRIPILVDAAIVEEPADANAMADRCAQAGAMRDKQGKINEPEWRANIINLSYCKDGNEIAHEWSKGHPRYDREQTQKKIDRAKADIDAPITCAYFQGNDPEQKCKNCSFKGRVTTPVQLGRGTWTVPDGTEVFGPLPATPAAPAAPEAPPPPALKPGASHAPDDPAASKSLPASPPKEEAAPAAPGAVETTAEATIRALAVLPLLDYERARVEAAEKLGLRVGMLDKMVEKLRPMHEDAPTKQGGDVVYETIEPWPTEVDGAALIKDIIRAIKSRVELPDMLALAVTLWIIASHGFEDLEIFPRLAITSPQMRCGKTNLLLFMERLVLRADLVDNATAAVIFRTVHKYRPTLLLDEVETWLKRNEEARGIINSGHHRSGQVKRTVGDEYEVRTFQTYCPMALAQIGKLPGTIQDRSIFIPMKRRLSKERLPRLNKKLLKELRSKTARWVADHKSMLAALDKAEDKTRNLPDELNDRVADNWRPLLAVADLAGEPWAQLSRQVAVAMSKVKSDEGKSTVLLSDIRDVFNATNADRLPTFLLLSKLSEVPERKWNAGGPFKSPLTDIWLAEKMKEYDGIKSKDMRVPSPEPGNDKKTKVVKCYERSAFEDAFARYLPPLPLADAKPEGEQVK